MSPEFHNGCGGRVQLAHAVWKCSKCGGSPIGVDGTGPTARRILFVGECRSLTAQRKGWTWADGRLAAKPLFEAREAMGVDPRQHSYLNLWSDAVSGDVRRGPLEPGILGSTIQAIRRLASRKGDPRIIVALGKRVSAELAKRGIVHVALIHPAARGAIRKRERYHAHVAERLGGML